MGDETNPVSAGDQARSVNTDESSPTSRYRRPTVVVVVVVGLLFIAVAGVTVLWGSVPAASDESVITEGNTTHRVFFENRRGQTLGAFDVWVADTDQEQYQGLSGTETLPRDTGLLFVYDQEAPDRAIVMREMNYPLDIVFIDGSGTVTAVHSAPTEPGVIEENLTHYTGRARWIVEFPRYTANRYAIVPGTSIRITGPTHTFESSSASAGEASA